MFQAPVNGVGELIDARTCFETFGGNALGVSEVAEESSNSYF